MAIPHFIVGYFKPAVIVGLVIGIIKYVGKRVFNAARTEWRTVTGRLERIENVQGIQAENHLSTIEKNTARTNEFLEQMKIEQAATNGYLKAIVDSRKS